jgi:predicted molibdopterin-dependent oxidoreductase YjgC
MSPLLPSSITLIDRPGMEVSLMNAMIQTIFKEGLEDKVFIEAKTEGIRDLRETINVLQTSEARKDDIEKAARAFAQAKKAMILIGSGSWSHLEQKEIAIASSDLALITGHMGKESSGILLLLEKCNSQGSIDAGEFPEGDGVRDLLQKAETGKLKALYLVGKNPLVSSSARGSRALEKVRLLIVQDLFMTDTAKMAHVVLPACSYVEKGGTFTNLERRIQKLNPLRPPLGQSKSDFEIFLQLLTLLESPVPGDTPEAVFEEISRLIPQYSGIRDGEQWPNGSPYLYADGFPIGKAKLIPVEGRMSLSNPEGYPFQLIQRPSLFQSGQLSRKSDNLRKVFENPYLEINTEDAQSLKIEDQEVIQVSTREGQSLRMKVKHSAKLVPGVMSAPYPCALIDDGKMAFVKVERLKRS